jgi:hypothetical protein
MIERLEPRYQLSGWTISPALPPEALIIVQHESYRGASYDYGGPDPYVPSELPHVYRWTAWIGRDVDGKRLIEPFSGTRLQAVWEDGVSSSGHASGETEMSLETFLNGRAAFEESVLEGTLPGSDWQVSIEMFEDGVFEQTARLISNGMPASERVVEADPERFEDQVFIQLDAPSGLPKDYSLLTRVWDARTGAFLLDNAHFDTEVHLSDGVWNVHLKHTHILIESGEYVVQLSVRDGRNADDPIIDTQTITLRVAEPIHQVAKPIPTQNIVWRGETVEAFAGRWSIQLDDSAPRSAPEWDGPTDYSLYHGPGANPALAQALQANGLNVELVGFYFGSWASIRIDPSIDPQAVEAALKSLPWVTGIEPSMVVRGAFDDATRLPVESAAPSAPAPVVDPVVADVIASPASTRLIVESRFSVRESFGLFASTGIDSQSGAQVVENFRTRRDVGLVESTLA